MRILSDSYDYAADVLPPKAAGELSAAPLVDPGLRWLSRTFLTGGAVLHGTDPAGEPWRYLVLSRHARRSQYDQLIELARSRSSLPDRLVCVAGSGEGFHGFKERPWSAAAGNLHVSLYVTPNRVVEHFDTAFTVLAALSVVDAVDAVPGLRGQARVKWVNDVLVGKAKVAGILSYTQTQNGAVAGAVVGIGLNVETTPGVERTAFVPAVGALRDLTPDGSVVTQRDVLRSLLGALDRNYRTLLEEGYGVLLDRYRDRSYVLGKRIVLCEDSSAADPRVVCEGRVVALGESLELYLEGREEPVRRGRLILTEPAAARTLGRASPSRGTGPPSPMRGSVGRPAHPMHTQTPGGRRR
ncbi:MAG: biotin--[acetyl-CoA-carboxylase] ligase [Gemmatimonadota bacterium]